MKERESNQQGAEAAEREQGAGARDPATRPCHPQQSTGCAWEHSLSKLDWTEQIRHDGLSVAHPSYEATWGTMTMTSGFSAGHPCPADHSVQPLPCPACAAAGTSATSQAGAPQPPME